MSDYKKIKLAGCPIGQGLFVANGKNVGLKVSEKIGCFLYKDVGILIDGAMA
jgi:hypothetical protein